MRWPQFRHFDFQKEEFMFQVTHIAVVLRHKYVALAVEQGFMLFDEHAQVFAQCIDFFELGGDTRVQYEIAGPFSLAHQLFLFRCVMARHIIRDNNSITAGRR